MEFDFAQRLRSMAESRGLQQLAILIVTVFAVTMTMTAAVNEQWAPSVYREGEVAARTVYAPDDVMIEDAPSNERQREGVDAARVGAEPVFTKIKRGQVIVRAGDLVSRGQARRLKLLSETLRSQQLAGSVAGYAVLSALVLLSVYSFAVNFWPRPRLPNRDLILVAITLVLSALLVRIFALFSNSLSYSFADLDRSTFLLATPVAVGGILLQVTLGAMSVFMFVLSFGLLVEVFLEHSWLLLLLIVVGNIVAALSVKSCSRRASFIAAGLRIASVNVLLVLCFVMIYPDYRATEYAWRVVWAMSGGLLSGLLSAGLVPLAEYYGRYITDIKLLELSSLDRPLLRELSLQAPGTWNHAMVMSQIAESAAEAIGANSLLARVGSYYHDIGKIKMPLYFVENQRGKENRHDKLTPSMSALIIKSHVKEGIELANQHRLPALVVDLIPQHHGTALIEYFYEKAVAEAENGDTVDESHYRYGGPKPQSREAGILMLADAVEAASRTIVDPSPAKIQGAAQKIINKVFASGQLEESDLTLRDLHLIAKSFTRVLSGIFHRRVEYSEPVEKLREPKVSRDGQSEGKAEAGEAKSETNGRREENSDRSLSAAEGGRRSQEASAKKASESDSKETLKRLGM